jgi:hypothetical protein
VNGGKLKRYRSSACKCKDRESSDTDDTILYFKEKETRVHFEDTPEDEPSQGFSNDISHTCTINEKIHTEQDDSNASSDEKSPKTFKDMSNDGEDTVIGTVEEAASPKHYLCVLIANGRLNMRNSLL